MTRAHAHNGEAGFGFVVIALLFTAFAVMASMALDRNNAERQLAQQQQVSDQLRRLSIALAKHATYNGNRLPCPASHRAQMSDLAFGAPYSDACHGIAIPAANTGVAVLSGSGDKLLIGMVPVQALVPYGLSPEDAFDPWGGRIMYAVHRDLTTGATDAQVLAATASQRATVQDYVSGEIISPAPDLLLISYGPDRVGARLRKQASTVNPSIACGGGQLRYANCDGDRAFVRGPLMVGSGAAATAYFDDHLSALRFVGAP